MFSTYFKTTFRNLWKNKSSSFLNIFGLASGIACAGLIFLWVENELTFDRIHAKRDRIFLMMENQPYDAYVLTHSSTPGLLGPALQTELPGIAATCRASGSSTSQLFTIGENSLYASGFYVEPSLFSMFTLPFAEGQVQHPFSQLHSLVLTEKAALKFFGTAQNVVGRTVRVDNKQDYVVSGVIKDHPANSSLQFEWVAPFQNYFDSNPWLKDWGNNSLTTYVELKPNVNAAAIDKQLHNFIQHRYPKSITQLFLFGMSDWHLYNQFENGKQTGHGRIEFVRLFSIIAWIILLIACINFMNLATARSENRSREVGVRKVLGAGKGSLVLQFIGEALFISLLGALAAMLLMQLLLPSFNLLVSKSLVLGLNDPVHLAALVLIVLVCGFVAGSYPSLYLSSFKPVFVLKGIRLKTGSAVIIRKGLVVLQFTISIVLIVSTIIIFQQIQHVKSRQLGFNKDNLIKMNVQGEMAQHFTAIRQELINTGFVENAALSSYETLYRGNNTGGITWPDKPPGSEILISTRAVSPEFIQTSGMQLMEGRNLRATDEISVKQDGSPETPEWNVMITESMAKLLGREPAIGKTLLWPENNNGKGLSLHVVGVVKDYVYGNMYGKPDPVVFMWLPQQYAGVLYIRIKPQRSPEQALAQIEAVLKRNNPGYPFDYRFVDEQFNQMFLSEQLMGKLARVFAALAILISCLGLFGLASYTAERRTREIGIRKVLGASVSGLARLLSKEFLQLVVLSCLIAFPVAWWIMHNWLQNYEYRISIYWWVFAAAGMLAITIALATVSFQAIRAALANPVKSLRTE
ncbi:MAG: ABC transporter permease [Williamsia sp.]|nr:ABC transporter permease [Williamsia sp.]